MKRFIYGFLILLLPAVSFASIDFDLKYGAKGSEVVELQEFLIDKGFLHSNPTGNFYSLTLKAAKEYQASVQLPSTGFVGPMTRGKINAELALNDDAEIQEVGMVTAPINTSSAAMTQQRIDELLQQVKNLLMQAQAQSNQIQQQTQILGSIQQNTAPIPLPILPPPPPIPADCTPSLSAEVIKKDGNITTGIDMMFYGTTTLPVGCPLDKNLEVDLQTPTVKYRGTVKSWHDNVHQLRYIDTGFTFSQGSGFGTNVNPVGTFIWYVGSQSIEVPVNFQ